MAQMECFQCNEDQIFHLEKLKCMDHCDSGTIQIESSQHTLSSFCRTLEYYIDPDSEEPIELGTRRYPYRSMSVVNSEIINNFSHKSYDVTIYTKSINIELEGQRYFNMSSVTIKNHPDLAERMKKAVLTPSPYGHYEKSPKAVFHILSHSTSDILTAMFGGSFTMIELGIMQTPNVAMMPLRTTLRLDSIDLYSEDDDPDGSKIFIIPIFLQQKVLEITNVGMNITGNFIYTLHPSELRLENITVDFGKFGFFYVSQDIYCNYPEAHLTPTMVFKNITTINFNPDSSRNIQPVFRISDIGNITGSYIDCRGWYTQLLDPTPCLSYVISTTCLPDDGQVQIISFDNIQVGLTEKEGTDRMVLNAFLTVDQHYRTIDMRVEKFHAEGVHISSDFGVFGAIGNFMDVITYTDISIDNCTNNLLYLLSASYYQNVTVNNLLWENIPNTGETPFGLNNNGNIVIKNFKMINSETTAYLSTGAILFFASLGDLLGPTFISFDGIHLENCVFHKDSLFYNIGTQSMLTIKNGYYKNVTVGVRSHFNEYFNIKSTEISNHTIEDVFSVDTSGSSSNFLKNHAFDIQNPNQAEINQVLLKNSTISLLSISDVIGTPTDQRSLIISNIVITNGNFERDASLFSLEGFSSLANLTIQIKDSIFSELEFNSRGSILSLQQQLVNSVEIKNTTFDRITNGNINVRTFNLEMESLKTMVSMSDCAFSNIISLSQPFISVSRKAELTIAGSTFTSLASLSETAGVIQSSTSSIVSISDSVFYNNSAKIASVFKIELDSKIRCTNCTIQSNFAITYGVVEATNNGVFEFFQSVISDNYAMKHPIGQVLSASASSIIDSTKISNNLMLDNQQMVQETTACDKLCFVHSKLVENLQAINFDQFEYSKSSLLLLFGGLEIRNNTRIQSQPLLIDSYSSDLKFSDSSISSIVLAESIIISVSTTLNFANMTISEISNPSNIDMIFIDFESSFSASDITLANSDSSLFTVFSSSVSLQDLNFINVTDSNEFVKLKQCTSIAISNISLTNSTPAVDSYVSIDNSNDITLRNFALNNIEKVILRIRNSNVITIEDISVSNSLHPLEILYSRVDIIRNSKFTQNGNQMKTKGGVLYLLDTQLSIESCIFESNTALKGGAIAFECTSSHNCKLGMANSIFINNTGVAEGGAISYNYSPPSQTNVTFEGNQAPYGPDYASYPVRIGVINGAATDEIIIDDVGPGIVLEEPIQLGLFDYNGQIMILDSSSQLTIDFVNNSVGSISGINHAIIQKGLATFEDFSSDVEPGAKAVLFKVSSNVLNANKIRDVLNKTDIAQRIVMNFRFCKPGEQILNHKCVRCDANTYSLDWSSTKCEQCMDRATCLGGEQVSVDSGYWRRFKNSTSIQYCPFKSACMGSFSDKDVSPTFCKEGYQGNLCTECAINKEEKYERHNEFECRKCPNPIMNAIRVAGLSLLVFTFFMVLIVVNVRKTEESELSVLLRILANYLQLITTSMSMSITYPDSLISFTVPIRVFGGSSEAFLSFDCFATDYEIKGPFESNAVLKLFLLFLLPIALFCIVALIWICLYYIRKRLVPNLTRNLIISFISIVFLLHPRLTQQSINIFRCLKTDSDKYMSRFDPNIECYSSKHLKYCFFLALPILIVWVVGMPLAALVLLIKSRSKSKDNKVKQYFIIIYQGLKPECFYWEFINTLRKILVLCCLLMPHKFKILLAVFILVATGRLQQSLKPYKNTQNNNLEYMAIIAGVFTILSSFVFLESDSIQFLNFLVIITLFLLNALFLSNYLFLLCQIYQDKYQIARFVTKIIDLLYCKRLSKDSASKDCGKLLKNNDSPSRKSELSGYRMPPKKIIKRRRPKKKFKKMKNRPKKYTKNPTSVHKNSTYRRTRRDLLAMTSTQRKDHGSSIYIPQRPKSPSQPDQFQNFVKVISPTKGFL
ncbi:unnamed protein product [Moneuplotes crassus]|uniref:Uncharacterized protein n=1 Tax=Euplotes crassus TaxID=5936 RepID=A0AAD1XVL1_EUPCR|nr:unnamed protein product [Moneuplotes crassus]